MQRIVILKFNKYNPRKDRKRHSWFRVDNTIFVDLSATPEECWLWITIIAQASLKQRDWVPNNVVELAKKARVGVDVVEKALRYFASPESGDEGQPMLAIMDDIEYKAHLEKLAAEEIAKKSSGNQLVTERLPSGVPTDRQTDGTDVTNESSSRYNEAGPTVEQSAQLVLFLSKTKAIAEFLPLLSPTTVEVLLDYEQNWLVLNLQKFIAHVKEKQNVLKASELKNLDSGLLGWLGMERKPQRSQFYAKKLAFKLPSQTDSADSTEVDV